MATPPPFRVGVLLDSLTQPAWVCRLLSNVTARGLGVIAVAVLNANRTADDIHGGPDSAQGSWLYRLYRQLDDRLFLPDCTPDAFADTDVRPVLGNCQTLDVSPIRDGRFDDLPESAVAALRAASVDVVLRFGFRDLRGDILHVARLGVWAHRHAADDAPQSPPGFREVMHRTPVTGSSLVRLGGAAGDDVLYRSWSPTDPFSVRRSNNHHYWKSGEFVSRALQRAANGLPGVGDGAGVTGPQVETGPVDGPGAVETAAFISRVALRYAGSKLDSRLRRVQWGLGLTFHRPGEGPAFDGPPSHHVIPPSDRLWADPFPMEHQGRHVILVEELLNGAPKAHISALEVDEHGVVRASEVVLETPHHLSYPHVFRWRDDIFMTPESSASRALSLYRAVRFPQRWEHVAVLMDGVGAADPTLIEVDGRWWMFVNLAVAGASNYDECHLFSAPTPEGPWERHPDSPIRSDIRAARPAGRLFFRNGRLYRPSQDCSVRYGYAIVVNEVERLSRTEYREREVTRIVPDWRDDIIGTHTLNHTDRLTVRDCLFRRSRIR